MNLTKINPHLTTTNIYVQREIVLRNIVYITKKLLLNCSKSSNYLDKINYRKELKLQIHIIKGINQSIIKKEQTTIEFNYHSS